MVASLSVSFPVGANPGGRSEYEVKAAFLLNFARLIEWPESTFQEPREPLAVCVVADEAEARTVEEQMRGASIGPRPIRFERISTAQRAATCHILYVTTSQAARGGEMIRAARGASVLTVGEAEGFARSGGVINFITEDKKIRFAINRQAAEAAGLRISSRLLRLAKLVSSQDDRP
jgi:hypothetical protein